LLAEHFFEAFKARLKLLDPDFLESYLADKYNLEAVLILKDLALEKKFFYLKQLKADFDDFYFNNLEINPERAASVSNI
jgi:hypothetical protein